MREKKDQRHKKGNNLKEIIWRRTIFPEDESPPLSSSLPCRTPPIVPSIISSQSFLHPRFPPLPSVTPRLLSIYLSAATSVFPSEPPPSPSLFPLLSFLDLLQKKSIGEDDSEMEANIKTNSNYTASLNPSFLPFFLHSLEVQNHVVSLHINDLKCRGCSVSSCLDTQEREEDVEIARRKDHLKELSILPCRILCLMRNCLSGEKEVRNRTKPRQEHD